MYIVFKSTIFFEFFFLVVYDVNLGNIEFQ